MCHGDYGEGVSQGTKVDGKMRRKEDGGLGGGCFLLARRPTEQTAFMIPTDSEGLNFHWGCLRSAVTKQEVAWGSENSCVVKSKV